MEVIATTLFSALVEMEAEEVQANYLNIQCLVNLKFEYVLGNTELSSMFDKMTKNTRMS